MIITPRIQSNSLNDNYTRGYSQPRLMIITPRIQSAPLNDNYTEDTVSLA